MEIYRKGKKVGEAKRKTAKPIKRKNPNRRQYA